ncbi:MAG: helix-turn-helix transcriptional regulator [Prevotella sp.]|nr:helix-turn-helix transcriptional regulator [Prevotella sp.]
MAHRTFSLADFAKRNGITDIFGAMVACMDMNSLALKAAIDNMQYVNFYSMMLIVDGCAEVVIDGKKVHLDQYSLLCLPLHQNIRILSCSREFNSFHTFYDATYYESVIQNDTHLRDTIPMGMLNTYHLFFLSETKAAEFYGLFSQIQKTITQPHMYKQEMLGFLVHLLLMSVSEMLYNNYQEPHDLQHKENIFKIFIHLAANNYKKHRQIGFYADCMNITSTYLSRIVREVSGNTVLGYLFSFLFNESCKLLKTTNKTIGEISDELSFKDQSAFTNFFKQKAGLSPKEYRKKSQQ